MQTLMQPLTRRRLVAYTKHCRDLVRDINHVLGDARLKAQKWEFDYAVDFSEVFGFILPQESHESWSFEGLMALTDDEKLRQFRVLARFFRQDKIYLPAPYAIELRTFYDRLRLESVDSMMREARLALDEISQLRENADVRRILEFTKVKHKKIDDADKTRIVTFLAENASYLRAFQRGVALQPMRRLQRLLSRRRLVDLATGPGSAGRNAPAVEDRYRRLLKQRQRKDDDPAAAASFLDAVAIELLRRVNLDLYAVKKNRRVLLISRSKHLMRLVENEARSSNLWAGVGEIVRHPRVFDPVCDPPDGWSDGHAKDLVRRRESLHLFVRAATEALGKSDGARLRTPSEGIDGVDEGEDEIVPDKNLHNLLQDIDRDWTLSENLATALERDDDSDDVAKTDDEQLVDALLSLIDRGDLFSLVNERLSEIFGDLNKNHEDLGFHLQQRAADRTFGNLVYALEFRDPKLRELSLRIARDWRVSLGEANALFQAASNVESSYERLLATALSLSALGRWQVAEDYVRRALLEADVEKVPTNEAKFLLAVCIRMTNPDVKRLRQARHTIDEALAARPADARYLKEKATILLRWNRTAEAAGGDEYREEMPSFEDIAELLTRALEHTQDEKLIAQIHNNFCYMYISPGVDRRVDALHHLEELERVLSNAYPDPATWPILMHDTICMAKFRLLKNGSTIAQLQGWARQLGTIAKSPEIGEIDRRRIERHQDEILTFARGASGPAGAA